MAELTLGLDLGSNSIGWALLDEQGGVIHGTGSRIFPEGVDRDKLGTEIPKNQERRMKRAVRRQLARRARRKAQLRKLLVESGILPPVAGLDRYDKRREAWETKTFMASNPYFLRASGLSTKLTLEEFGRAVLHLNQRRGFQSNRKVDKAEKENSKMLEEIGALAKELKDRTLGQYLYELHKADPFIRIRNKHTRRDMYQDEFERLWKRQTQEYPQVLTAEAYRKIKELIFFQRKILAPDALIGRCELEPRLPRCPKAHRAAQYFRILQEVNNLRVLDRGVGMDRPLCPEERTKLITYLSKGKERDFDAIRKHLFTERTGIMFNLERGERKKLKGMETDALLSSKKLIGKAWDTLDDRTRDLFVYAIMDADEGRLSELCKAHGIPVELASTLADINLPAGYMSYSLHAIRKLTPSLEKGLPLTAHHGEACAFIEAGYTRPWDSKVALSTLLPEPPALTNPLVRQGLHEVRKVVNAILRELVQRPGHTLKAIHLELAREVKGTPDERAQRTREMREREQMRDDARKEISEAGIKPTHEAILRYRLWHEQGQKCLYSGESIGVNQLFGGEVDVDHILPYSRSLDDSQGNKVVCLTRFNRLKGNRTPYEWLAESDPQAYEALLNRVDSTRLDFGKKRRFRQQELALDDFFNRQFQDTAYITTKVREYLEHLGVDVQCSKGQHTAELRWQWGLNTVLREDGLDIKNREDHRHHAVDALIVALTARTRLQQLARIRKQGGTETTGEILPEPWPQFRTAVEASINAINVSHRTQRKASGALHEDTIYGQTPDSGVFVVRKSLESLTLPMVDEIRDKFTKTLVLQRLKEFNIDANSEKIPKEVWQKPLTYACNNGTIRIVKKVRVLRRDQTIQSLNNSGAFVKPGSTHHLCIFEKHEVGKLKREAVFTSMLEAARRIKRKDCLIQRKHPTDSGMSFLMSIAQGETFNIIHKGQPRIVVFKTAASTQGQIYFVDHRDARPASKQKKIAVNCNTLVGEKVSVDPLGRIRRAHD